MKLIERLITWIWGRKWEEAEKRELRQAARKVFDEQREGARHERREDRHQSARTVARRVQEHEEHVPGRQGKVARRLFEALAKEFDPGDLSFGGGTVLAARWQHRESRDVDLFCRADVFAGLGREARARIEERVKKMEGCDPEVTWCEDIGLYTEVDGIEATMLPRGQVMPDHRTTVLAGTALSLQTSEEILYAKIVHRMYEADEITVRDAYDVACAQVQDPEALNRAVGRIDEDIVSDVIATISNLPKGWTQDEQKPLLGARYEWNEGDLTARTAAALVDANEQGIDQRPARSIE